MQPVYHGLDAFCEEDTESYFRSMLLEPPVSYSVRYLVGTPDGVPAGDTGGRESTASATAGADMWGTDPAVASRRRNPFLERAKRYIEYDEEIVPSRVADSVMRVREQLADEFAKDLRASGGPRTDNDDKGGDSSPLREANADLVSRLATRSAALEAIHHLKPAAGRYLKTRLAPEPEAAAAAAESASDGDLSRELCALNRGSFSDALGDHHAHLGKADAWLDALDAEDAFTTASGSEIDPPAIRATVLEFRDRICADWADAVVASVRDEHLALKREILEIQLSA